MNNNTKLCGGISGATARLVLEPEHRDARSSRTASGGRAGTERNPDGQLPVPGRPFSSYAVRFANNARSDGPIVGSTMIFDNNVSNDQFETITTVPVGMPGNPAVYAQPNPPQLYSGWGRGCSRR